VLSRQIPAIAASAGLRQIPWHAVLPVLAAAVFAGFLAFTRRERRAISKAGADGFSLAYDAESTKP
jgi:hypothetical protein